jgi:hypothetical protein
VEIEVAWQNLEYAVKLVEEGADRLDALLEQVAAAIYLLLEEFSPEEIVAQAEASPLPTRAAISWLVYEGGRIRELDPAKVEALRRYWEAHFAAREGRLIPPPPPGLEQALGDRR